MGVGAQEAHMVGIGGALFIVFIVALLGMAFSYPRHKTDPEDEPPPGEEKLPPDIPKAA